MYSTEQLKHKVDRLDYKLCCLKKQIESSESGLIVVENYSALPDPTTVDGTFYWVSNSQGTRWLPGSLGGTYYTNGIYYSNGVSWEYIETPYQATQSEVNAGINNDKFVTPKTLNDYSKWSTKADTTHSHSITDITGLDSALRDWIFYAGNVEYNGVETTIGSGIVLECNYKGNSIYRFISNTNNSNGYPTEDSFYTNFNGVTLTNKITQRNV